MKVLRVVSVVVVGGAGCSSSASMTPVDAGGETVVSPDAVAARGLSGTVRDRTGTVVSGARVAVGAAFVFSDSQGRYQLNNDAIAAAAGAVTVSVTRDYFQPLQVSVELAASGPTVQNIVLDEIPLQVQPADRMLAMTHAATFDRARSVWSIAVAPRPSRRDLDNAIYFHNPALHRDRGSDPALAPSPAPQIAPGPSNFSFPIGSGPHQGQQALDLGSIVDTVSAALMVPTEPADFMMWTPMINWLVERDPAKAADLRSVGVAVQQQTWGGNAIRPQEIEKAYLDAAGRMWVKVVFGRFVQLGPGINDDDGDGASEIYARVNVPFLNAEIVQALTIEYAGRLFDTHGLSKELTRALSELYSTTAAKVERTIGQPIEIPGLGTINHPFVVLSHQGIRFNVILVGPGP